MHCEQEGRLPSHYHRVTGVSMAGQRHEVGGEERKLTFVLRRRQGTQATMVMRPRFA